MPPAELRDRLLYRDGLILVVVAAFLGPHNEGRLTSSFW
jgi:hypothetical protein